MTRKEKEREVLFAKDFRNDFYPLPLSSSLPLSFNAPFFLYPLSDVKKLMKKKRKFMFGDFLFIILRLKRERDTPKKLKEFCFCRFDFNRKNLFFFSDPQTFPEFRFIREPDDKVVLRNSPAILDCSAEISGSNFPPPTIRWKRDGEFLQFPDFNDRR